MFDINNDRLDINKRKCLKDITVKDLIHVLELENPDAKIHVGFCDQFYMNITDDNTSMVLSGDACDDVFAKYIEEGIAIPQDIIEETTKPISVKPQISRMRMMDLLLTFIDNYYDDIDPDTMKKDLKSLGFTDEEMKELCIGEPPYTMKDFLKED